MALLRFADSAVLNMSIYSFKPGNVSSDDARNSRSRHAWSQEPSARTHGSLDIAGRLHPVDETAAQRRFGKLRAASFAGWGKPGSRSDGCMRWRSRCWPARGGGHARNSEKPEARPGRNPIAPRLNLGASEMKPKRLRDLAAARGRRLLGPAGGGPASLTGRLAINLLPATPSFSAPASAMGSNIDLAYRRLSFNKRNLAI